MIWRISVFIVAFGIIYAEILNYNTQSTSNIIECTDGSTNCVINCASSSVCATKQLHCHGTSRTSTCTINLNGPVSAEYASIHAHQSRIVYINVTALYGCHQCKIHAHEQLGSKLHIYVDGYRGTWNTSSFAPVGKGSLLSIRCGQSGCAEMKIYDDWTSEIYMEPLYVSPGFRIPVGAFSKTETTNIFNDLTLGISRPNPNYAGLNTAHQAAVILNGSNSQPCSSWIQFKCNGHNHGDWTDITTDIFATLRFMQQQIYHPIRNALHTELRGITVGNTIEDTLKTNIWSYLTLNTDGTP